MDIPPAFSELQLELVLEAGEVERLGRLATTLSNLGRLDHGVELQATPDPLAVLKAALERSHLPAEARGRKSRE